MFGMTEGAWDGKVMRLIVVDHAGVTHSFHLPRLIMLSSDSYIGVHFRISKAKFPKPT